MEEVQQFRERLSELTEKSKRGEATTDEHRTILLLMTLLNKLPPNFWWQSEV